MVQNGKEKQLILLDDSEKNLSEKKIREQFVKGYYIAH